MRAPIHRERGAREMGTSIGRTFQSGPDTTLGPSGCCVVTHASGSVIQLSREALALGLKGGDQAWRMWKRRSTLELGMPESGGNGPCAREARTSLGTEPNAARNSRLKCAPVWKP